MAGAELGALQGGAAPVPLRRLAVERALDNLLGNALRYGTRARLSLRAGPGVVTFTVEDDGPGIPPARREDAQRPFVRLDAARNQDRGPGVGLGLAIARDVARSHGGALRLSDSAELGGLRVDLDLAV
jgi:two-component system osmolarity sensor histidine kinase EnvZ